MKKLLLLSLLSVAVLYACNSKDEDVKNLSGTTWEQVKVLNKDTTMLYTYYFRNLLGKGTAFYTETKFIEGRQEANHVRFKMNGEYEREGNNVTMYLEDEVGAPSDTIYLQVSGKTLIDTLHDLRLKRIK